MSRRNWRGMVNYLKTTGNNLTRTRNKQFQNPTEEAMQWCIKELIKTRIPMYTKTLL